MNTWIMIVLSLGVLLLVLLLFKEYRRANKARLLWRMVATFFAIAGFTCLALPVYYKSLQKNNDNTILILTPGYNEAAVRTFVNGNSNSKVYLSEAGMQVANDLKASNIPDVSELVRNNNNVAVHVFGFGFTKEALTSFNKQPIIFHPTELPQGITAIHWPAKLKTGETVRVQGYYNNPLSKPVTLVLSSYNKVLDSVVVAAASHAPFDMKAVPVHLGRAIYQLIAYSGKDTLSREPMPLEIEQARLLNVLVLATSPDFENKFLKNWMSEQGHLVVVKTAISANKFNNSFSNVPSDIGNRITAAFLSLFDVVKADAGWFSAVPKSEAALVLNAVAGNKIGLIVTADSVTGNALFTRKFPLARLASSTQQVLLKNIDSTLMMQPLKIEAPVYLKQQNNTQAAIIDQQGRTFAGNLLYGSGKVLFTTVTNSFIWSLAGHHKDYTSYWTMLLQMITPSRQKEEAWSIQPFLPKIYQPATVKLQTNQPGVPTAYLGDATVYLKNNPLMSNSWAGLYWPSGIGWQPLVQSNGKSGWWFVYKLQDWKTVDQFDRLQATAQYALSNKSKTLDPLKKTKKVPVAIPGIYFFLIILLSAAYLWYEKKLSS